MQRKFILCLLSLVLFVPAGFCLDTPISLKIKLNKTQLKVADPLEGTVVMMNRSTQSLSATFNIKMWKNGEEVFSGSFNTSILPGQSKYSLKEMDIPQIQFAHDIKGRWRLEILQQNAERKYAGIADFIVK
jgi:hypothetical protein